MFVSATMIHQRIAILVAGDLNMDYGWADHEPVLAYSARKRTFCLESIQSAWVSSIWDLNLRMVVVCYVLNCITVA